jgi:hypothetical protein
MHTSLSFTLYWCSMSRRVSGITCPSSGGTTQTKNCGILCAHNSHQLFIHVVPPEDGQVMPETCQDIEPQ